MGHKPTEVVWGGLPREGGVPFTLASCLAESNHIASAPIYIVLARRRYRLLSTKRESCESTRAERQLQKLKSSKQNFTEGTLTD